MGIDKFFSDFYRLYSDGIVLEEINLGTHLKKLPINHIYFDFNSTLYRSTKILENEINTVIKLLLSLSYTMNNSELIMKEIEEIFTASHWEQYKDELNKIFDQIEIINIYDQFKSFLFNKSSNPIWNNLYNYQIIIIQINLHNLISILTEYHYPYEIKSISIFFDGIPSVSKIYEQKRRRYHSFLESTIKKKLIKKLDLFSKKIVTELSPNNTEINFNYIDWINKSINLNRPYFPESNFMNELYKIIKRKFNIKMLDKLNIPLDCNIYISDSKEHEEGEIKMFRHFINNINKTIKQSESIIFHSPDCDVLLLSILTQNKLNIKNIDIDIYCAKHDNSAPNKLFYISNINKLIDSIINVTKNRYSKLKNITNNIDNNIHQLICDNIFIIFFLGNDYLPSINNISFELDYFTILDIYLNNNYNNKLYLTSFKKTNLITKNIDINYDLNLSNFFEFIKKLAPLEQSFKIRNTILNKTNQTGGFFKILNSINITNYENIVNDFFKPYWVTKTWRELIKPIYNNKLIDINTNDIKYKLALDIFNTNSHVELINEIKALEQIDEDKLQFPFNISNHKINLYSNNYNYWGMIINNFNFIPKNNNNIENLYLYVTHLTNHIINNYFQSISKTNMNLYILDNIKFDTKIKQHTNKNNNFDKDQINSYITTLKYLINKYFNLSKNNLDISFWYYPYNNIPEFKDINNYIKHTSTQAINKISDKLLEQSYINNHNFDFLSHHLFITPYTKSGDRLEVFQEQILLSDEHIQIIKSFISSDRHNIYCNYDNINNDINILIDDLLSGNHIDIDNLWQPNLWNITPYDFLNLWNENILDTTESIKQLVSPCLDTSETNIWYSNNNL